MDFGRLEAFLGNHKLALFAAVLAACALLATILIVALLARARSRAAQMAFAELKGRLSAIFRRTGAWRTECDVTFDSQRTGPYTESIPQARAIGVRHVCPHRHCGGETVSTGVRDRWMHAERHRLVNPVEHH